jgi:predicted DNA binding CopG/RHH family protein
MSDEDRFEKLLDRDWGDAWESLPSAPPLVLTQPKSAQMTLRVPAELVTALKEVAQRKELPYHGLARSLVADGLHERRIPSAAEEVADLGVPGEVQLNLKMTPELLDEVQSFSDEIRIPYHRLARLWIDTGLRRALAAMDPSPLSRQPSLGELMILLLDAPSPLHTNSDVRGITRLQKLLFVIEKHLAPDPSRFYSFKFGPFDEQVHDAADALQVKGLLQGPTRAKPTPPTVEDMMASVLRRSGPRDEPEIFALTPEGREAAKQLRQSSDAYMRLAERIGELRQEWDQPDLVEHVYRAFPEYTSRSVIKEKIARREEARKRRQS